MSSFLTIWLDYYEEDFHDPPEFPALTKLMNFTGQYLPDSTLDRRVNSYFEYLRNLHQAEFEDGGEEDWGGRVGDRVGHTDQASVLLGQEHWVGSHPIPTGCSLGRPPRALALTHVEWSEECP